MSNQSLPEGVERWTPKAEYQQTRAGFEKVATMAPDEEGYYLYLSDLPKIIDQAKQEERERLEPCLFHAPGCAKYRGPLPCTCPLAALDSEVE